MNARAAEVVADLAALAAAPDPAGVLPPWSAGGQDLRSSLVVLPAGTRLGPHVNRDSDLVLCGISGRGAAVVEGRQHPIDVGVAVHVPRGLERILEAGAAGPLAALVVHRAVAASSPWRWRPRRRRPWEDPWEDEPEEGGADAAAGPA